MRGGFRGERSNRGIGFRGRGMRGGYNDERRDSYDNRDRGYE